MPKSINFDKLKKFFEKAEPDEILEKYHSLGEYLHELIQQKRDSLHAESDKLKSLQEQLNSK